MKHSTVDRPLQKTVLIVLVAAALLLGAGCRNAPEPTLSTPEELAELPGLPSEVDSAAQAEDEAAEQRVLLLAQEAALAEREAELAAAESRLEEERALEAERRRLAAREAEIEDRERELKRQLSAERERVARIAAEDQAARNEPSPLETLPIEEAVLEPEIDEVWVEASLEPGTVLEVELLDSLSSRHNRVGDTFTTRVARDLYTADGVLAVPAGSEILGRVVEVRPLRRVGGQASLGLELTHLVLSSGVTTEIRASFTELGRNKKSDKKKILAAAAAGAILGQILGDKSSSTRIGAAVGAAAGTAIVASAKGQNVEIPAGEIIALRLDEVVTVTTRMVGLAAP